MSDDQNPPAPPSPEVNLAEELRARRNVNTEILLDCQDRLDKLNKNVDRISGDMAAHHKFVVDAIHRIESTKNGFGNGDMGPPNFSGVRAPLPPRPIFSLR